MKATGKYLGNWEFYRKAIMIALPVMLQSLIQNMVSLIDNFMVSGLGDIKMSGVNVSGQILFVFMVLLTTICTSGGIFMTQFSGAGDKRGMQQALVFKVLVVGVAILLYLVACMVVPRWVLGLMVIGNSQAGPILDVAVEYMFLMGFIGIPMAISTIIATSSREIGNVKAPLVISVIATCINTFLNWVLIYGNLGAPRLEVKGAAYATILARVVECIMYLIYVKKTRPPFLIKASTLLHIDWRLIGEILRKGSMVLFSEMLWAVSETITTAIYNGRGGADVVSGMASSFAIANLFFVSFGGITTATAVILGQTLGAGELERARKEERWLLSAGVIFGIIMMGVGLLTMALVPVIFGRLSGNAQEICRQMVFVMSLFMPLWVYQNAQFAVSRAGGDTIMGVIVDASTTFAIILPGLFLIANFTNIGPVIMYLGIKLVDILKVLIAFFWLKKERWVKNLTKENCLA